MNKEKLLAVLTGFSCMADFLQEELGDEKLDELYPFNLPFAAVAEGIRKWSDYHGEILFNQIKTEKHENIPGVYRSSQSN